jgi:hypothetical protein
VEYYEIVVESFARKALTARGISLSAAFIDSSSARYQNGPDAYVSCIIRVIYSLIGTARLNGIEPFAYLRTVFERIADHPINRIDELLPWRLMPAEHVEQQAA